MARTPAAPKSAMMLQYEAAKQRHPGMMLLFRIGDFYEAFGYDAEQLAKVLGLTVTSRDTTSMAGFPYHQLDGYLRKLLGAGHRVALCDQVDEAPASGAVEKVVTKTTPAETAGAPADPDLDALGRRWVAGESIAQLGKEAGVPWQRLHGLLTAKGYRKAGRKADGA